MSGTHVPGDAGGPDDGLREEVAQLHEAMLSQRDIGMAIGLLSARFRCSTEQAWRTILRISQDSNTKVRTVARVLVSVHDGTAGPADHEALRSLAAHLPASGWPSGPPVEQDRSP
ncbi:ANTAR domain-containing protein [Nocardioides zeicaulis]|uniref:ANTAR domain-containing protein n=1 Tax=Nocardioides zeicaulis TaxID=1776857 RepID=A0ABV6E391_9ACTN